MIIYNRRKTKNYNIERQKRNEQALAAAMSACAKGTANIKQRVLVKRYEMVKDAEEERVRNRGALARAAEWVMPGIMGRQSEARLVMKLDDDIIKSIESGELPRFLDEVQEPEGLKAAADIKQTSTSRTTKGGRLDYQAEEVAKTVRSWWPWR
jgi:hypothetical protein